MPPADMASRDRAPLRSVAIAGASGFLGTTLAAHLESEGVTIRRLRRDSRGAKPDIRWNPARGEIDVAALEGLDAVVNLSGEPIAQRWTADRKSAIRESRI